MPTHTVKTDTPSSRGEGRAGVVGLLLLSLRLAFQIPLSHSFVALLALAPFDFRV